MSGIGVMAPRTWSPHPPARCGKTDDLNTDPNSILPLIHSCPGVAPMLMAHTPTKTENTLTTTERHTHQPFTGTQTINGLITTTETTGSSLSHLVINNTDTWEENRPLRRGTTHEYHKHSNAASALIIADVATAIIAATLLGLRAFNTTAHAEGETPAHRLIRQHHTTAVSQAIPLNPRNPHSISVPKPTPPPHSYAGGQIGAHHSGTDLWTYASTTGIQKTS